MSTFDTSLLQQLEAQRAGLEALRLSLRANHTPRQQYGGCACSPSGTCGHHAYAWNALLDAEQALYDGVRALEADAYQNGDGPRPGWWDSDDDAATIEAMLGDVDLGQAGERGE